MQEYGNNYLNREVLYNDNNLHIKSHNLVTRMTRKHFVLLFIIIGSHGYIMPAVMHLL